MSNFVEYRLGVKRKILVVDDEEINRMLLTNILEEDYDVLSATNGQEALEIIRKEKGRISVILLDLLMPVMDGYSFLEQIEGDDALKKIPVIVLTSEREAEVHSLTMGAADFIPKPYDAPEVIRARIGRIVKLYEDRNIITATQYDAMTGLYNKEYFFEYATLFDQYYPEDAKEVITINVNRFHVINAMQGRDFGDKVLATVGKSIKDYVSESMGVACRYGADRFFVYVKAEGHEEKLMKSICDSLRPLLDDADTRIRMGVYVGSGKSEDLPRNLDHALLACNGISDKYNCRIAYYNDKLQEKEHFEEMLIHDLERALTDGQIKVFYQPKYAIQGEKPLLTSAEALVRWEHPELGMISPGKFIPIFEQNGMIGKVDRFVWKEAARQIARWKEKFGVTIPLSVNVSRVDVLNEGLAEELRGIVDEAGIDVKDFYLELTESAYVDNQANVVNVADKLREAGFRIEMDDFGTGYSSLNMLTSLPFDVLKLDMIFVRNVHTDSKAYRLVEFIMDVAKFLGVMVIAEGVEQLEQYEILKKMGCDVIQGYYFSKPVTASEFERFITD